MILLPVNLGSSGQFQSSKILIIKGGIGILLNKHLSKTDQRELQDLKTD